jgi:hypothetical protein
MWGKSGDTAGDLDDAATSWSRASHRLSPDARFGNGVGYRISQ